MKDDQIREYLLSGLTKEELLSLLTEPSEPFTEGKLSATQKFYLSRKIPGSTKRCSGCGQSLVNSEEHAAELLGIDEEGVKN